MTSPAADTAPERLTAKQRQDRIVSLVSGEVFLDVGRLSDQLAVTPQTIRRDLRQLAQSGRLQRHHGGAAVSSSTVNIGYGERQSIHHTAKQAIARVAVARIPDGASLFINIGTTTEAVAHALQSRRNLRVVTNNLHVAMRLSKREDFEVTVAGGIVRRGDGGVVGEDTIGFINQFQVDFGIIGISAIDPASGSLLDFDLREVRVSQAIIRNARHVLLVADHSKFSRTAMVRLGSLADVNTFCTDRPPPRAIVTLLREHSVELLSAG